MEQQPPIEAEPAAAVELAGDRIEALRDFARDLGERGEQLGLIGPLEPPRLWTRHLLNSAVLAPLVESGARVADIGTGGGMPGLVLAIVRPDARFLLIEPMERRCNWLNEQIDRLGLENAEVRRGRAEEYHGAFEVDQITARGHRAPQAGAAHRSPAARRRRDAVPEGILGRRRDPHRGEGAAQVQGARHRGRGARGRRARGDHARISS